MQHILSNNMKNDTENDFNNLVLKTPPSLSSLFNQFNDLTQTHGHKDPENVVRSPPIVFLYFTLILAL